VTLPEGYTSSGSAGEGPLQGAVLAVAGYLVEQRTVAARLETMR
jgi:hypothetical protein